jgi:transglutaminase-like putative cysteine protease
VQTRVSTVKGYVQQWLPMPYPATSVLVDGNWRYEPEGRTLVGADPGQTAGGLHYTVNSLSLKPDAQQLRAAAPVPSDIGKTYLSLPKDFPQVVRDDATTVTKGAATPYDKAVALQDWFTTTGGFSYNTQVRADTGSNAMVDFLRNRQGFCVHFAGTMAAMARSLGIPARVSIGFTPGTKQSDGSWLVGTKDAHAWPELYFSGVGWIRFEPTPGRGITPDYSSPASNTGAAPSTSSSAQANPKTSAGPRASTACDPIQRREGGCPDQLAGQEGASTGQAAGPSPLELAGIVVAGLALVLLLTPMLWRLRARSRRLRRRPSGKDGVELTEEQVLAAWRELIDSAWDIGIPPDEAETPRRIAARIVTLGDLDEEPRAAAGRLALATEQVLYAPRMGSHPALRQDVRLVRHGLLASVSRSVRLRSVLFPPSSVRITRRLGAVTGTLREAARQPFRRWQRH